MKFFNVDNAFASSIAMQAGISVIAGASQAA
jgi:hypothetical protein